MLFPVKDHGKTMTVAYSGGMGFNFPRSQARFDTYIASAAEIRRGRQGGGRHHHLLQPLHVRPGLDPQPLGAQARR